VIAVAGATGNLGGLVVDRLLDGGVAPEEVVPFVRSAQKGEPFAARGMEPRVATYDDPAGFARALAGIDKLVLISPPSLDNAVRLEQLHGAVRAAHGAGLAQLAVVGLSDPEQRAFALEAVDLAIEHSIPAVGLPFTFLRHSPYLAERRPALAAAATTGAPPPAPGNRAPKRAPAAVRSARPRGASHRLVRPEPHPRADTAPWLAGAGGREVPHREAPAAEVLSALVAGGMEGEHARSMVEDFHGALAEGKCRT